MRNLLVLVLVIFMVNWTESKPWKNKKQGYENYLKKFGYLNDETEGQDEDEKFKNAVMAFQDMTSLPMTGDVDDNTETWMDKTRCGQSDIDLVKSKQKAKGKGKRSKRFAITSGGGWPKNSLTYRILNFPTTGGVTQSEVNQAIARAFKAWSDVTDLQFTKVSSTPVDIDISFASFSHGDGNSFDGPGKVLAHAFTPASSFPISGDTHFDDSEVWRLDVDQRDVIDLFQVAVHEFGHSLGLGHSDVQGAVMYAFYSYNSKWELQPDDIAGIKSLYDLNIPTTTNTPAPSTASPSTHVPTTSAAKTPAPTTTASKTQAPTTTAAKTPAPTTTAAKTPAPTTTAPSSTTSAPNNGVPDFCVDSQIDAMTTDHYNRMFVFKGQYYARMNKYGLLDGYPRLIQEDFPELPSGGIDAAVYVPKLYYRSCKYSYRYGYICSYKLAEPRGLYIFSGNTYYYYTNGIFSSSQYDNSGIITDKFGSGIPSNIDSVFSVRGLKLYFTKGNQVWRVTRAKSNPAVDKNFPQLLNEIFIGLPSTGIDSAFHIVQYSRDYYNFYTYFFSGSQYYRVTNHRGESSEIDAADPQYPRLTSDWWFDCQSASNIQLTDDVKFNNNKGKGQKGKGKKAGNNKSTDEELKTQQSVYIDEEGEMIGTEE